jgi:hypothetical protein
VNETQVIGGYVWSYLSDFDVVPQVFPFVRCGDCWCVHFARHPGQTAFWLERGWAKAVEIPYSRRPGCLRVELDLPEPGFWKALRLPPV